MRVAKGAGGAKEVGVAVGVEETGNCGGIAKPGDAGEAGVATLVALLVEDCN